MSFIETSKKIRFQLLRWAFRLTPMPGRTRDKLRQRFLDRHFRLLPSGPKGIVAAAAGVHHRARMTASGRAIGYVSRRKEKLPSPLPATLVAFYLPQFHPIKENDAWWGEGFTEWHNVTRALPQFEGHCQPRLPAELGFYDLRLREVMHKQIQLAHEYGIGAFCSYFYWFGGKTLLELPLQRWLEDSSMDLPICLCWANENWSRRWDGRGDETLMAQNHSADDDVQFISHVSRYLADPRYLRVDGKPLLLVYRPSLLPDARETALRWRNWCNSHGIGEIHLCYVQSFDRVDPRDIGFDSAVEFPPNNTTLEPITAHQQLINPLYGGDVLDWRELAANAIAQADPGYRQFPCVNPGWDNEPRRSGNGRVFAHASPNGYRQWLIHAISTANRRSPASPLVFINAWNEWAEGAVLEPDTRLGYAWLHATRAALVASTGGVTAPTSRPCVIVHAWYVDVLKDILSHLRASDIDWRIVITTTEDRAQAVRECVSTQGVSAEIEVFENRGRDILPFLHVATRLVDEGVDVVLKLHTKRSTHRQDGERWREELLQKLLSRERAIHILEAFRSRAALGLAAAEGHIQPLSFYWGANEGNVDYLSARLGIAPPMAERDSFIAGSMFWVRLSALRPLLDAHLGVWEFEDEAGQLDGTLAHAVERIIGLTVTAAGYSTTTTAELCGLPAQSTDGAYPYAARSH